MIKLVDLCDLVEKRFLVKAITLQETEKYCGAGIFQDGKIIDFENDYSTLYRIYDVNTHETNECDRLDGHKLLLMFSEDCVYVHRYTIIGGSSLLDSTIAELFKTSEKN